MSRTQGLWLLSAAMGAASIWMAPLPCRAIGAEPAPRGLWLLPRKDAGNTARADLPGRMSTTPREVWSVGGGRDDFIVCKRVEVGGATRYFGQVRSAIRLTDARGRTVWQNARMAVTGVLGVGDLRGQGGVEAIVTVGSTAAAMVDVATGGVVWTWSPPNGAYLGSCKLLIRPTDSRFVCFPLNTLNGYCFRLGGAGKAPELMWERTYAGAYWAGYGPQIVLADMDNDSRPEVVVAGKPGYVGVADLDTGAMRFDLHYKVTDGPDIGRPYGLLTAQDLDGDGYRDVVMASCQVEEYVGVVRNVGGKALALVWSQFVEKDYPDDRVELRPNITSVADLDGDGKPELVVGLYNTTGDGKWHTVAFDPMGGYSARRMDLPGRFFWGCWDMDGDGAAEVVTSSEAARRPSASATYQIVDGRTGRDVSSAGSASLTTWTGPTRDDTGFMGLRASPVFVAAADGGLLIRRRGGAEELWRLSRGGGSFARRRIGAGARSVLLSMARPNLAGVDQGFRGADGPGGADAANARVSMASGVRELIVEMSDGRTVGGVPDWRRPGRFRTSWSMPGAMPSVWIGPDGRRVVCTAGPAPEELHIGVPDAGSRKPAPLSRVPLPFPVYLNAITRSGSTLLPFGDQAMRLFVGLQTGVHTLASALYDEAGKELWLNKATGPYPRSAAAARLGPDGAWSLVVNDHYNKAIYRLDGSTLVDLPYGSYRGGIMVNSPYTLPIVGPFGADGASRILFTPGLDTIQSLDASGAVLMNRFFNTYEFEYCGSAVASLRPGAWDVAMVNHDGILHCVDALTGRSRWTMDLGTKAAVFNVSTVDVDGDGRDNLIVGLPTGELLALDERDGKGVVLWRKPFAAGIRDAFAADLDGDGHSEIIVETEDGRVRVLAAVPGARRP